MRSLVVLGFQPGPEDAVELGQVAEEQKRWPQAIQWYEQIQEGDHALNARMRTAGAMAKQGRLDDARKYLREVASDNPGDEVQLTVVEAQLLRDAHRHDDAFALHAARTLVRRVLMKPEPLAGSLVDAADGPPTLLHDGEPLALSGPYRVSGGWWVREIARDLGLGVAGKADSQDICFVPDGDYATLVRKLRPEADDQGDIVHIDGTVLCAQLLDIG